MSAPILATCTVVVLALGLPVLSGAAALHTRQKVIGAADSAALAAADAVNGWVVAEPCDLAATITSELGVALEACTADATSGVAQVTVGAMTPFGGVSMTARAGPPT